MSGPPEFRDLVGDDVTGAERERLLRAHELLVAAGPPPELSPRLQAGPSRRRAPVRGRALLLLAAALAVGAVFAGGYAVGSHGGGAPGAWRTLQLHGTGPAPAAEASLEIRPRVQGNWPMTLTVSGLPALPRGGYYEVYLLRDGKPWAPCGSFVVAQPGAAMTLTLNAPYRLRPGDTWIVTRQLRGAERAGRAVLVPA